MSKEKPSESWTAVAQDNVKKLQEKSDSLRAKCKEMSDGSGLLTPTCHEIPQFCYNSMFLGFLARPLVMTRPDQLEVRS